MRAPLKAVTLLAVMVLASFSVASGQSPVPAVYVDVAEVTGLTAEGYIPEGGTELVIPIRFINVDVRRTAISNGYKFTGPVTYTNLNAAWNAAYPWDWMMAMAIGVFPPYFDQGLFINYFGEDLYAAPTTEAIGAGMAGLTGASGSGLPPTFNGIAYRFTLSGVSGDAGQVLTMDTTWWQPANYWLWTAVGGAVSWNGPIEFMVDPGQPLTPPVFTSTPVTTGQAGVAYTYDVDASGFPAPTYSLSVFAAGMEIDATTGVITWTPSVSGTFNVTVVATNSVGSAQQSFQIVVEPANVAPSILSYPVMTGQVGVAYTYDVNASGYPAPTYSLTAYPDGMTIDPVTGVISWTPAASGTFDVTVVATNVAGDDEQSYQIVVAPAYVAPVIVPIPNQTASTGLTFTYDVNISEGYPVPTFSLVTAPAGMTINSVSGMISWLVDQTGVIDVTVRAENTVGFDEESFTITVSDCSPYTLFLWPDATIHLKNLPDGRTMQFGIFCDDYDRIDWNTIRVFNIPPYTFVRIENDVLVTDAFVMRFLGAGGFRPVPSDGYLDEEYPLYYTYKDGPEQTLYGIFSLSMQVGDVTFDGVANIDDVVFMTDFFFNGGPTAKLFNEKMDECMDIDQSSQIDLLDVQALIAELNL